MSACPIPVVVVRPGPQQVVLHTHGQTPVSTGAAPERHAVVQLGRPCSDFWAQKHAGDAAQSAAEAQGYRDQAVGAVEDTQAALIRIAANTITTQTLVATFHPLI